MQLKPINQQVVAVVGASSGIGRKTALDAIVSSTFPELKLTAEEVLQAEN